MGGRAWLCLSLANQDSDRKNLFIFALPVSESRLLSAVSRSSPAINTASIPQVG